MSRWHRRLAEMRGDQLDPPATFGAGVQNVQNVKNSQTAPGFEHFERFEHGTASPTAPPAADGASTATERTPGTWREAETARAAIVQFDGGIPREWAEGFARLDPDYPPGDVPPCRWQRFVDDVGRFLDSPFCAVAAALGWGPHDLFGCDRDRPFAGIDGAGLIWLLNGDRLVALTHSTATVETRTGVRKTYRRRASGPERVLTWEAGS